MAGFKKSFIKLRHNLEENYDALIRQFNKLS